MGKKRKSKGGNAGLKAKFQAYATSFNREKKRAKNMFTSVKNTRLSVEDKKALLKKMKDSYTSQHLKTMVVNDELTAYINKL